MSARLTAQARPDDGRASNNQACELQEQSMALRQAMAARSATGLLIARRALACVARSAGMRQAMIWCQGSREGYGFGKQVKSDYLAGGST